MSSLLISCHPPRSNAARTSGIVLMACAGSTGVSGLAMSTGLDEAICCVSLVQVPSSTPQCLQVGLMPRVPMLGKCVYGWEGNSPTSDTSMSLVAPEGLVTKASACCCY